MANPITITATVAVWVTKGYNQRELMRSVETRNPVAAIDAVSFYGAPDREKFGDFLRVGEADVTLRLIPKDEQTKLAVQALQQQLAEERAKWHERQQAILAEISKLQALTFDAEAA